ncbi:MAG: hypothetical protein NT090_02080 [Acidobacteria bacterium]|nr:hypothetical protein [Acidobacteriota bacterium]
MSHDAVASRRGFIQSAAGMGIAAAAPAAPEPQLPKVKFFKAEVTRLIIGSNPLYGYSHFNSILDRAMKEWMTQDQRLKVLKRCEEVGINTWQVHFDQDSVADLKRYRDEGGKMNWLLLGHGEMMKNPGLIKDAVKLNPIGIAHHGNLTDDRFRAGEMDKVRDFYRMVQDAGVPGGISTHNPAVVDYVEGRGWDNDYFMTCLYRVTRTPEDSRREFGEAPMGETYFEKDPERMCKMIRQTRKTCFAFKLLAAGRGIDPASKVERMFRFVFSNIKPQDAAIVGMWPRFKDEPKENAGAVRRVLASLGA